MYSYWQVNCVVLCEVAFVIKSLKEVLSRNWIWNIYFTKFHSVLRFGILFWGGSRGWIRIKRRVIRSTVAVSTRTSCRALFKELNILTLVSLYIMAVICYIRKHHQLVDLNSNIHAHNTQRKMDIHIKSYNTDLCERSVINMGAKLYNTLPGTQNKQTIIRPFRRNWKHFFFFIYSFYSVEESVAL